MPITFPQAAAAITALRGDFFSPRAPIHIARAPARLDVMGGIADYSGSLVLEATRARVAYAAVQPRRDRKLRALTLGVPDAEPVEITLDDLLSSGRPKTYPQLRRLFTGHHRWAGYVLGALAVLRREGIVDAWPHGLNLLLLSDIPIGAGVASSAAIAVAAMTAITAAFDLTLEPLRLAQLCQRVENHVVGAPCGIMDQVTSALGKPHRLLALRCRPCDIEGLHRIPAGYQFVGINSAVKHSVGGTAYGRVRCAAFMGYTISCGVDAAQRRRASVSERRRASVSLARSSGTLDLRGKKPRPSGGYWCNLTPDDFAALEHLLPEAMSGADFLRLYPRTHDTVTTVHPDLIYPVRQASRHPVLENARVERFLTLLRQGDDRSMQAAGKLMYESHASYSACGLGSDETDLLVKLIRDRGPDQGFLGAKITGGGSGGTVAVLIRDEARPLLREVIREYRRLTGRPAVLLSGSTSGAAAWGTRVIN